METHQTQPAAVLVTEGRLDLVGGLADRLQVRRRPQPFLEKFEGQGRPCELLGVAHVVTLSGQAGQRGRDSGKRDAEGREDVAPRVVLTGTQTVRDCRTDGHGKEDVHGLDGEAMPAPVVASGGGVVDDLLFDPGIREEAPEGVQVASA